MARTDAPSHLRGYGDSDKPAATPDHAAHSKRAMAADMVALMRALGHERFDVLGLWRAVADEGSGGPLPGAHYLAEEIPDALLREVSGFLGWDPS